MIVLFLKYFIKTCYLKRLLKISRFWALFVCYTAFPQNQGNITYEDYIRSALPSKTEIDVFLNHPSWAKFDSELGYTLGDYMPYDGIYQTSTISTSQSNGARTSQVYTDRPCRINTYGNSFTQCHQVSDAETWQEYVAGHLGEPVRNFGVGGYGVYQAYRRMLREESTENSAENIIFYIWGDDHIRSLFRCRYMCITDWIDRNNQTEGEGVMFHGNFWANLEMDLETGEFVEYESRIQSEELLYNMTNEDWMVENLRGDLALQMVLYRERKIDVIDTASLKKLSELLGLSLSWQKKDIRTSVEKLLDKYAFESTKYILLKTRSFAAENNKKLLVVLFSPYNVLPSLLKGEVRSDQEIVDFLNVNDYTYFDMNLAHVEDYKDFNLSIKDYLKRYLIGHYSPIGNHFFAYKIIPHLVEMLEPKPITYSQKDKQIINFKGYLNKY